MVHFEAPIDLRMPISRVRSRTEVYIDWKITRKPMMTAMPMTTRMAVFSAGTWSGVISEYHSSMVITW